jgi:4-hydroxy-2-oxoheptanedioate aldolase
VNALESDAGLRARLVQGETLFGTFLNTGSAICAEICGRAGFDWALVDLEHGSGAEGDLVHQLQALAGTGTSALVRVEANERPRVARALDLGAEGVMVPRVDSVEEAELAASYARYPPEGVRGVAFMTRGYGFGARPRDTSAANRRAVCIVQVESEAAVASAGDIAAIEGIDALFVGPSDLTHSMDIPGETGHPRFLAALDAVERAARAAGKATGIVIREPEEADAYLSRGFQLISISGDAAFLAAAARNALADLRARKPG